MAIEIHRPTPAQVRLVGLPKSIKNWRESRQVYVDGAEYTKAYKKGWDGYKKPGRAHFNKKTYKYTLKLGRGWLEDVKKSFDGIEVQKHYEDACTLSLDDLRSVDGWDMLRDYQKAAIRRVIQRKWGRIALATNAGKGAIIALLARAAIPEKTIILADEVAVFDALVEEIEKWAGIEPGLVESGAETPPEEPIVVAMVPTLYHRLKDRRAEVWAPWLESFRIGLLDEADRSTSDSWQMVCDNLINTEYRAGFSGSFPEPGSMADFNLMGSLGPTLIRVKNKELVERDISARPVVQLVPYDIPAIPEFEPEDPVNEDEDNTPSGPALRRWTYKHAVLENSERHKLIKALLHPEKPNAIIVNRIIHGEKLTNVIPDSIFLSGSDSKEYRREVLEDFKNGVFQNLIATNILDRGTNLLGNAVGLIFASGAGSSRQTLQRIGRGLRKGDGKEFLFLRDIMDRGHRYLDKASKKRFDVYLDEDFEIEFYEDPENIDTT